MIVRLGFGYTLCNMERFVTAVLLKECEYVQSIVGRGKRIMRKLLHDLVGILSVQFIIVLVLAGLGSLGYLYRKPLFITYHRLGQRSALKAMRRTPTSERQRKRISDHGDRVQHHTEALIRLAYLAERSFQTEFLAATSPQTQAMFEEFRRRHPGSSYSIGWSKALTITDRPERMSTWEPLIREYDVPPTDPNQPATLENLPQAEIP